MFRCGLNSNKINVNIRSIRGYQVVIHEQSEWDFRLVNNLFQPDIAQKILNIPLSLHPAKDEMFWCLTNDGIFSVRSAYRLGLLAFRNREDSGAVVSDEIWSKLWALPTLPKLKHFVWRFCHGHLGVFVRLQHRHIRDNGTCPRCNDAAETPVHAVLMCSEPLKVWSMQNFASLIRNAHEDSSLACIRWLLDKVTRDELIKILSCLWASWFCRNAAVMKSSNPSAEHVLHSFTEQALEFRKTKLLAGNRVFCQPSPRSFNRWISPPNDMIKVNCDATTFDGGSVGVGCVLKNHLGQILAMEARRIKAEWDACTAEFAAVRLGAFRARELGFKNVIIESDSLSVISALKNRKSFLNHVFNLLNDVRLIVHDLNLLLSSHVKRGGNCTAHYIARLGPIYGSKLLYLNSFPQGGGDLTEMDLME